MTLPVDIVRIEGQDATSYLQGQLSQDVEAMATGAESWTYVLTPSGHVDAFAHLRRVAEDAFELDVDAGFGEAVEARLRKFLLRTKATITIAPAAGEGETDEATRIAAGRPAMGKDVDERSVPAELGWLDRAVSFTKGCYTGQELVARMDSRVAEPPRRLVRLSVSGDAQAGAEVIVDDTVVGSVTSAAAIDHGAVALAYVKRGTDLAGRVTVAGIPARIDGVAGG